LPDERPWLKLAIFVLLIGGVLAIAYIAFRDQLDAGSVVSRIRSLRQLPFAPVIFVAVYALLVMLALPGSSLTLAGGAATQQCSQRITSQPSR
jgi:uncharacterized membrane protein YdjX (TVP38/TMEM64 family)